MTALTHKNSLVSKESYRKVFERTEKKIDMGTSLRSMSKLKFFFVCKKFSFEWCSHKTFDKKKILEWYREKPYEPSLDKFWVTFNSFLER